MPSMRLIICAIVVKSSGFYVFKGCFARFGEES